MKKDKILSIFSEHKNELVRFDVRVLYLFGSFARDEGGPDSDIDILVGFNGPSTLDHYFDLKFYLEELLERKVDLVTEKGLRLEIKPYVERECIRVA